MMQPAYSAEAHKKKTSGRSPAMLVIVTIAICVALNAAYLGWQVVPGILSDKDVDQQLADSKQQLESLQQQSAPKALDESLVEQLLSEVPTVHAPAEVLEELLGFSAQTGARITRFQQSTPSRAPQSDDSQQADEAAASGTNTNATVYATETYQLSLIGALPTLLNYIDLMAANKRLTSVEAWQIAADTGANDAMMNELEQQGDIYSLSMTYTMYALPDYEPIFGKGESQDTSIDEMLEQLQRLYPGAADFQSLQSKRDSAQP